MTPPNEKNPSALTLTSLMPLLFAALGGAAVALLLSQLQFNVWLEPSVSKDTTPPVIEVIPTAESQNPAVPFSAASRKLRSQVDGLRVHNTSPYTIRVVLLSRQVAKGNSAAGSHHSPIHWDFAPEEGGQAGLLLSLPEGVLTLQSGDILVAFALDGSRHYWGPYVVGQTRGLTRSPSAEWELVLTP